MSNYSRMADLDMDELFPGLLTQEEMQIVHEHKKARAAKLKKERDINTPSKLLEVDPAEFIIKGGGIDDNGRIVDDFDMRAYMDAMEDKDTGLLHDLKIDLRDVPLAKNFYDYCFRLSGKKIHPPWSRQLWIGAMLFGEVCTKSTCTDPDWLNIYNVPKDFPAVNMPERMTFLEHGKCPHCGANKLELIQHHGLGNYIQLVNVLGQRSGKSSSMATYAGYHLHRILKFQNYASLSKTMQASTEITGTMVSLTFAKAKSVMWTPFKQIVQQDHDWFKMLFDVLDDYKLKFGKELYTLGADSMHFKWKNIRYYPSGPKSSTLRGDTRIFAALDELGLFRLPTGDDEEDEASEMANADEAHKSLLNSLTTVNGAYTELLNKGVLGAPPALLMSVSSPMSQRDKVMRLLRESKTEEGKKTILGINLPTWEVNPSMTRQTPVIAALYASNPEKAERDFGANPPLVHSRFILPDMIEKEVFINGQNSHELEYRLDSPGHIYGSIRKTRTFNQFPSVVAIDAGSTNNSFAIAAGHFDFDRQKTVVTTLLECVPQEQRRVEFNKLYESAILPLCKELYAVSLNADQWNSIDLLHRARADMGLNPDGKDKLISTTYSLRRSDFENFRAMLENKSLILPSVKAADMQHIIDGNVHNYKREMLGKPVEHSALQMITIRDMGETKCPEKGEGFTDDILRALVLLVARIHHPKTMERLQQARPWVNSAKRAATGKPLFVSRSGMIFGGGAGIRR